jgi:hypothetical protein
MRQGVNYRAPQQVAFPSLVPRIKLGQLVAHGLPFYIGQLAFLRTATIELAFGLQPIIKLIAGKAAALEIDFMCAEPDLFAT